MKNDTIERIMLFVMCLIISVLFYVFLPSWGRQNIRAAEEVVSAPRATVTVTDTWTRPSGKYTTWWMSFEENVASTRTVQISKDEYSTLLSGLKFTIAILPDGTPHSLDMNADPTVEKVYVGIGIAIWAGTTFYVVRTSWRWFSSRRAR